MIIIESQRKAENHKFLTYKLFTKMLFPVRQLIWFEKYMCIKINKKQFKWKVWMTIKLKWILQYSEGWNVGGGTKIPLSIRQIR